MTALKDLVAGDVVRRGPKHDIFIGASQHPEAYETKALAIWIIEGGNFSYEATDWDEEVGYLSSYRNSNLSRLKDIFPDD